MGRKRDKKLYILLETEGYRIVTMEDTFIIGKSIFCPYKFLDSGNSFDRQTASDISQNIRLNLKDISDISSVSFVSQGLGDICKEVDVSTDSKRKEILDMIEIEMNQFYNIYTDEYRISYREYPSRCDIDQSDLKDDGIKVVNAVLFPKSIVKFMEDVAGYLSLKIDEILLDINILQAYADQEFNLKKIDNKDSDTDIKDLCDKNNETDIKNVGIKNYSILEVRQEDLVVALVEYGQIVKSMVLTDDIDESLVDFLAENGEIFLVGNGNNPVLDKLGGLTVKRTHASIGKLLEIYEISRSRKASKKISDLIYLSNKNTDSIYRGKSSMTGVQSFLFKLAVLCLMFIFVLSLFEYRKLLANRKDLADLEVNTRKAQVTDDIYSGRANGNIYGIDIKKYKALVSLLGDKLISISSNKDESIFEFKVSNEDELTKIASSPVFKNTSLISVSEGEDKVERMEKVMVEKEEDTDKDNIQGQEPDIQSQDKSEDGANKETTEKDETKETKKTVEKTVKKEVRVGYLLVKAKFK